jgi:hypothetical protein
MTKFIALLAFLAVAPAAKADESTALANAVRPLKMSRVEDASAPERPSGQIYARSFGSQSPADGKTAVDYRLARGGFYGSAGFICLPDDPSIADHAVGVFDGSQDGRLLGATIRYPLK